MQLPHFSRRHVRNPAVAKHREHIADQDASIFASAPRLLLGEDALRYNARLVQRWWRRRAGRGVRRPDPYPSARPRASPLRAGAPDQESARRARRAPAGECARRPFGTGSRTTSARGDRRSRSNRSSESQAKRRFGLSAVSLSTILLVSRDMPCAFLLTQAAYWGWVSIGKQESGKWEELGRRREDSAGLGDPVYRFRTSGLSF